MNPPQISADTIHYGPVWNKPDKSVDSFSLCDVAETPNELRILSNHAPSVTCPHCKALMSRGAKP